MKLINWDDVDIGPEEINAALKSLSQGVGVKGENLELLEKQFQQRLGCKHAIPVSNCTTALMTSLLALKEVYPEIKKIAVPSFTFIVSTCCLSPSLVANICVSFTPSIIPAKCVFLLVQDV